MTAECIGIDLAREGEDNSVLIVKGLRALSGTEIDAVFEIGGQEQVARMTQLDTMWFCAVPRHAKFLSLRPTTGGIFSSGIVEHHIPN